MDYESSSSGSRPDFLDELIERSNVFLQEMEDEELANFFWKYVEEQPVELLHLDHIVQIMEAQGKQKRRRVQRGRSVNLWDSGWGSLLRNAARLEENTYHGRLFRRRFRLPYAVFKELVDELRQTNAFGLKNSTKIGLEFRVLIGLRILGRAWCADDVDEALNIGESTVNYIFKDFLRVVDTFLFKKYVHVPEGEELLDVMRTYERMGFSGCVGSMDCTHIYWSKCPKKYTNLFTGKENKPTAAFQVVVDHTRKIRHCSKLFYGAYNDKNITNNDTYPYELMTGTTHTNVVFRTYTRTGESSHWKGVYVIVDGGYQKTAGLVDGMKHRYGREEVLWSEFLESIRKDVECTFGILKARWRFLEHAVGYHDYMVIEHAMHAACVFHNMLLAHDGYDQFDWDAVDPDDDEPWLDETIVSAPVVHEDMENHDALQSGIVIDDMTAAEDAIAFRMHRYGCMRAGLIKPFAYVYARRQLRWPKSMPVTTKARLQTRQLTVANIINRVATEVQSGPRYWAFDLYVKASPLRGYNTVTKRYDKNIGFGLFSNQRILPHQKIAIFRGEVIDVATEERRTADGKGGYMLHLTNSLRLDCYEACRRKLCMASFANWPRGLANPTMMRRVESNAVLKTMHFNNYQTWPVLVSKRTIEPHNEILYTYNARANEYIIGQPIAHSSSSNSN